MTSNVQGELLVVQEKPLAKSCYNIKYESPLAPNSTKTWIDVNIVHDVEVINSSTENNEHNEKSHENKTIEVHKKNKLRRFI